MNCICGKKLTECRDECCNATLRAMCGEWVDHIGWRSKWVIPINDGLLGALPKITSDTRFKEMLIAVGGAVLVARDRWEAKGVEVYHRADTIEEAILLAYIAKVTREYEEALRGTAERCERSFECCSRK